MARTKKVIKELKQKVKVIKELDREESGGENELADDMEKAERKFRETAVMRSGIEAPSLVPKSDEEENDREKTQIRTETRERVQLERENESAAEAYRGRERAETTYRQYNRQGSGGTQTASRDPMLVQNTGDWQATSTMTRNARDPFIKKEIVQPVEIEREEDKREYETRERTEKRRRVYPWEA